MNYCFENQELLDLFVRFFPEASENAYTIETLLREGMDLRPPAKKGERISLLARLLAENEIDWESDKLEKLLLTLETLRESLILDPEQIEHCFLSLPQTPKNLRLKQILNLYLQSPLADDTSGFLWNAIEQLKNKSVTRRFGEIWHFVPEGKGSFLFQELAKAFAYAPGVASTGMTSFWKLSESSSNSIKPIAAGSDIELLEELSQKIHGLKSQGSLPIFISIFATPEKVEYLRLKLRSLGISVSVVCDESHAEGVSSFLSRLRHCKSMPLHTRLSVWHGFKTERALSPTTVNDAEVLNRFFARQTLEDSIKDTVRGLLPDDQKEMSATDEKTDVYFLPWICLPQLEGTRLAYCDESLFHTEKNGIYLTNLELEQLFQAGFPMSRPALLRQARMDTLEAIYEMGSELYASLDPTHFEALTTRKPKPREKAPVPAACPSELLSITPSYFSATQLETYAQCPAKYLYSNRLRFRKEAVHEDRSALFFGQATHLTLERFFAAPLPEAEKYVEKLNLLFNESLTVIAPQLDQKHSMSRLLRELFRPVARLVPKIESELKSLFPGATPTYFEKDFKLEYKGKTLVGKIDRIDTLPDGSLLVIDYKTGTVDFSPEHIRKGDHFQALLYLYAAQTLFSKKVAGVLFYDLKKGELRRGIFDDSLVSKETKKALTRGHTLTSEKLQSLTDEGFEHLNRLTTLISEGHFDPSPSLESCRFCDYRSFCRRAHGA